MASVLLVNPRRKRRHKKHARRRHTAARRRHHRARRRTIIVAKRINPRRRHRVRHHKRRHRVRNPRFSMGGITRALVPAAIGGAGAVALDIALGYAQPYIPAQFNTGYLKVGVQVLGAFGLGYATKKLFGPEKGNLVTMGGLTVAGYNLLKALVKSSAPSLPGLAGDGVTYPMGAYMPSTMNGLGYTNAAPNLMGLGGLGDMGAYMPSGMPSDGM